ncbi:probable phospholipid-transporting ATPase VD isoform X7 [Syngnathoides biaculeatus]|uniref:probable phospholipid-transporting ATPase VD isoform X7 n=1 Tax=Syngnathoides biaculeatus TaxID=300417 RepID=UPI002ADE4863|nr:probable phospholipid-transporting ATPase VD isoform X7 [Syngnathoides biaculeatus]
MEGHHWMANQCRQLLLRQRGRGDVPTKRSENSDFSSQKCNMKRRTIIVGQGHDQQEQRDIVRGYKGNIIHTTKYTLLTFIPINLFQQFHRAANLYFLFLILLNWVPVVEAFQKEITMIPLLIVLTVIAIKDALEDYKRYLSDKKINNNVVQVYCGKEKAYNDIRWKDVQVGDFVRLSCNDIIPADILLLYSSDLHGICYIETSNLDGETNLKQRKIVSGLPLQGEEFNPESFHSHIECENPNNDLGTFRGFMVHSSGARAGLDSNNLLLRSCTIRNTETVVGIVVYAGHETKAMMNNSGPRYKRSHLEKHLNIAILWCFLLLIIMCFTTALGHGLWLKQLKNAIFSVDDGLAPALAGFYTFWTMIIVLQVLIPISLYVSIEIVKLGQIYFIQNDLSLYNEHVDCSIQCRALNITENLGQIQYLFSDKTGTLTENNMVFRRCSIYGIEYPHEENGCRLEMYEAEKSEATDCSVTLKSASRSKSQSCRSLSCNCSSVYLHTLTAQSEEDEKLSNQVLPRTSAIHRQMTKEVVPDPELVKKLSWLCSATQPSGNVIVEKNSSLELTYITDFFLALGICNSVVVSSPTQPQYVAGEIQTSHKSLDERKQIFQCFPLFSGFLTQSPTQRRGSPCSLSLFTRRKTGVFTLSSLPSNTIEKLFVTQEGNVNLSREVDETNGDKMKDIFVSTNADSNGASDNAQEMRIEDVPSSGMDDELLYEAVSPDEAALVHAARSYCFTLRGRSADDLLIDLPGIGTLTVQLLHILPFDSNRKRMSVVVRHPLTGKVTVYTKGADSVIMDILETPKGAEQAWETYNHIKVQTQKHLDSYAREGLRTLCITKKVLGEKEYEVWLKRQLLAESSIDNREELLLDSAERLETNLTLLELSHSCKAVICCRSTPLQKSQVVQLIRDKLKVMTLAVGDGANDVSMIQVSDVGIGISGQEGIQAVMSSDFAISRFKHLSKLLLVHGHWCFSRLGNMMFYFIYKNVMFVNLLFWYQFFCGFSGSVMTNSWVLIFFNLFFTSVPPLIYGILDKDIPAEQLMQMPELYQAANASEVPTHVNTLLAYAPFLFWMTVLDAFYQSLVCFFVPYFAYVGSDIGELSFGSPINASALLIILLLQVIESHTTTWIHVFVLVLSGGSYFGFVLIFSISCLNCSPPTNPLGVEMLQMSQPLFYIVCTLTTVTALMPRVVFRALHNTMHLSALMLTSYREKAESEKYHRRRQHKTLNVSMASRQPDCADNSA